MLPAVALLGISVVLLVFIFLPWFLRRFPPPDPKIQQRGGEAPDSAEE